MKWSAAFCTSSKEVGSGCDGARQLLEFLGGAAYPWQFAVHSKKSKVQQHLTKAHFLFVDACPPAIVVSAAVSVAYIAKVLKHVYEYCKCAPHSIYAHPGGNAFALRTLAGLNLILFADLQCKRVQNTCCGNLSEYPRDCSSDSLNQEFRRPAVRHSRRQRGRMAQCTCR